MRRTLGIVLAIAALGAVTTQGVSAAAQPNWHLYGLTPSDQTLSSPAAKGVGTDLATFTFPGTPTANYLMTGQNASGLLGDLTGDTVAATFNLTWSATALTLPSFVYDTSNGNTCGTPATVRLFLETSNAGGFNPSNYWWSNPSSQQLSLLGNGSAASISAMVDPTLWSNFNGQFGTADPTGFAAAASNVKMVGLSFGGGCFFANGVGVDPTSTSAVLHLTAFSD